MTQGQGLSLCRLGLAVRDQPLHLLPQVGFRSGRPLLDLLAGQPAEQSNPTGSLVEVLAGESGIS